MDNNEIATRHAAVLESIGKANGEAPKPIDNAPPQADITEQPDTPVAAPVEGQDDQDAEENDDADSADADGDEATAPKRKQSRREQKRFDRMTRDKYEAIRRADALELRLQLAEQYIQAQQPQQPGSTQAVHGEPTLEQFGYDQEAFQKAERQWLITEAKKAARQEIEQEFTQRQIAEQGTRFNQRVAELEKKMPGAWQRATTAPLVTTPIMEQVIFHSDVGPEVGVYLAEHLDDAQAISRLPPMQQAVAMGRIEAAVKAAPAAPPRPPKALTAAPAPSAPLPSGSSASKKKLEDQSIEDRIAAIRQYSANH
jgi:hypothetical protein